MRSIEPQPTDDSRRPGQGGFSLIEVMLGAACTVLFLGATLSLVNQHSHQRQLNREIALASNAAADRIESLRNVDFALLPAQNGTGFDIPSENGSNVSGLNAAPGDLDGKCGSLEVTVAQSSGWSVLYRVTARVTWSGISGVRTFSLQTLMGDRR